MSVTISEAVKYIGVDDKTIDLFESQYVVPHGVSYNSYLIFDEKVALMDTVDARGHGAVGEESAGRIRRTESGLSDSFPSGAGSCRKYRTSGRAFPGSDPGGKCQDISDASTVF